MQFTDHFRDGLDIIPLKKGDTSNLLIHLESKYLKQQYISAHVILDFAKNLECEVIITLLLKMSFACNL